MITEDDLRGALREQSYDIDVRAALRLPTPAVAHRRPVPVWAVVTTAAVVVVLAAGVTLVATGAARPSRPGGLPSPGGATVEPVASGRSTGFVPRSRFDVRPVGALIASTRDFAADRQDVWFETPLPPDPSLPGTAAAQQVGLVIVWEPGAYDTSAARAGTPVDVGGRPGWYGDQTVDLGGGTERGPALTWQWPGGTWAVAYGLQPEHRSEAYERTLAASVTPRDASVPVPVPVRLPAAPAGLVRQQLSISYDVGGGIDAFSAGTVYGMTYRTPANTDGAIDYSVSVTVLSAAAAATAAAETPDPTTPQPSSTDRVVQGSVDLDGRTYEIGRIHVDDQTQIDATARGARVSIGLAWQDAVTPALDVGWLRFTPAASLDDPTTWFDAATAFP